MSKMQCYIGAPNGVVLCIDRLEAHQISGRLYHGYSAEGVFFLNEEQMLFQMERFFDEIRFPHPTTNSRTFSDKKQEDTAVQERTRIMSDEELLSRHGDLGTFVVRVQHRQNSSWQGSITWTEKNKTIYFRSVWEMIKLIESAMDTVSEQEGGALEASWLESGQPGSEHSDVESLDAEPSDSEPSM